MKNLYSFLLALLSMTASYAAEIIAVNSGSWSAPATWNTSVLPGNSDLVVIPTGITVTIDDVQQYSAFSLVINVMGTIRVVSPGKIDMAASSIITVYPGGRITGNGSPSETIKIGGTRKFIGTEPDITGPKMANSASGSGFIPFGILPVRFIAYNVVKTNNNYHISWATSEEVNSAYFEVERSNDGLNWKSVSRIQAAGHSSGVRNYSHTDRNVSLKAVHYRIKQADHDGRTSYTEIKSFRNNNGAPVAIAANRNQVVVHFPEQITGSVEIQVVSITGQVVTTQKLKDPKGQVSILARSLKGQYVVTVRQSQQISAAQQVIL